jgi:hypothetical protein
MDQYKNEKGDEDELGNHRIDGNTINPFSVLFDEFEHG